MPKWLLPTYIEKVLLREGFVFISQKGSHKKYRKSSNHVILTVIVAFHRREVPLPTFKMILKQSEISEDTFKNI